MSIVNKSKALDILREVQINGLTLTDACELHGMSVGQFKSTLAKSEDGIRALQEIQMEDIRTRLGMAVIGRVQVMQKLIDDGLDPLTKPSERVSIYKALDATAERLTTEARVNNATEDVASSILQKGPALRPGKNRMGNTQVTFNIETLNINAEAPDNHDVIDGEVIEPSE